MNKSRPSYEELEQDSQRLRRLTEKLSSVERDERKKLSMLLHDYIQPLVVGARMQVWQIQRNTDPVSVRRTAEKIEDILSETLDTLRSLSTELSPVSLQNNGLIGGFQWLKTYMKRKFDFTVNLSVTNRLEPVKEETCYLLYEGVKELLFNAVKHAGVDSADVLVRRTEEDLISLIVADQGKGFIGDFEEDAIRNTATLGIFSIQERLASIGGRMLIETSPDRGTKITLTAPAGMKTKSLVESVNEDAVKVHKSGTRIQMKKNMIGILIVDDHKVIREGLKGLLQAEPDFHILGEASSGKEALERANKLAPDVILMDINLGDMHGIRATHEIILNQPDVRIIGLSIHNDQGLIDAMYAAGAVDYLTKNAPSGKIIQAIRKTMN